jgi:hypothetical protein
MKLPELTVDDLARLRLKECQGTLIGGLKIAQGLGLDAAEFGYRMMMEQGIGWARLAGNLDKIAQIFHEHYQVTYGFGAQLTITLTDDTLRFEMPSVTEAAAGQLHHWQVPPLALEEVNRGFWRALTEHAGITAALHFTHERHTVTVTRNATTRETSR